MAQALEKVNMSPNLGKMFSFAQKMVILFQNSVFGEIQFSQKSLINRTRRKRLNSAPYLRLKKRKTFFFGKKLVIFEKKISFKKSRIVPKNVEGGPFGID